MCELMCRVVNSMQVVRNDKAPTEHPKCYAKILTFSISTKTLGISVSLSSLRDPRSLCCESDGKITRSLELSFVELSFKLHNLLCRCKLLEEVWLVCAAFCCCFYDEKHLSFSAMCDPV